MFQTGWPCPETQELQAGTSEDSGAVRGVCRCPPGTALHHPPDEKCYHLHGSKPCPAGQYFAPPGECRSVGRCPNHTEQAWWPRDLTCYTIMTRGPCPRGRLVHRSEHDPTIVECRCKSSRHMWAGGAGTAPGCYEHGTRGPCLESGHIFMEDGRCGCEASLLQHDNTTNKCWEIGARGPCERGQTWHGKKHGGCRCKPGLTPWPEDGRCYRPYTRGPCATGRSLTGDGSLCGPAPCHRRGYLYVPGDGCHRPGQRGPCLPGNVVAFDLRARPSLDGPSYRGVCTPQSVTSNSLSRRGREHEACPSGQAPYKTRCHALYSRGPCPAHQWLIPNNRDINSSKDAMCDCQPPYTRSTTKPLQCLPPVVNLVNYLNKHFLPEGKS